MTCTAGDCDRRVIARGMCGKHYSAWQRAGKPSGHESVPRAPRACGVAECDLAVYAKGHCPRHYRQLLRSGSIREDVPPAACAVDTCERKAVTRGWCHGHYTRWSRGADVRAHEPLTRDVIDTCVVEAAAAGRPAPGTAVPTTTAGSCTATPRPVVRFALSRATARSATATGTWLSVQTSAISYHLAGRRSLNTAWSWPRRSDVRFFPRKRSTTRTATASTTGLRT